LFGDPAVVILDEPNSNLDMEGEEALLRSLRGLKERKRTVIFVSHKIGLLALSDKSLILAEGRMRAFGPTKDVLQPKAVAPLASAEDMSGARTRVVAS
jgi:ABC-type protease/lipase transport system fused ATPase/permease subunit